MTQKVSIRDWEKEECTADNNIDLTAGTLRKRVAIFDELGAATSRTYELLYEQAGVKKELWAQSARGKPIIVASVKGPVWAKKEFWIEKLGASSACLALRMDCEKDGAVLLLDINGHTVSHRYREEREYWEKGWEVVDIPARYLREGLNEIVLRARGRATWKLYIDNSKFPNRSAKSFDKGKTWDYENLGVHGSCDGEYITRLNLEQYPKEGKITSPVIDLGAELNKGSLGFLVGAKRVRITSRSRTPQGTSITFEGRAGSTPLYESSGWSSWAPVESMLEGNGKDARYIQWRAILRTDRPRVTPKLGKVSLEAEVDVQEAGNLENLKILELEPGCIQLGSYPFAYQHFEEPRLSILRERYKLDDVVKPAKSEFEKLVRLRRWARRAWKDGWNRGAISFVPPFDALVILELTRGNKSLGMCTHYSAVFVQACLAMGYTAKLVIIMAHCVAEVWSNEYRKWVLMDTAHDTNDKTRVTAHYVRDGVPMSSVELHKAFVNKDFEGIEIARDGEMEKPGTVKERLAHYNRISLVRRNNYLTSIYPEEPEHGAISYTYDGHVWYEDEHTPPLPQFSLSSTRDADFCWTLNQTELHPHLLEEGVIQVDLATVTPNFDKFLVRTNQREWRERPNSFRWRLRKGLNELEVKSVNKFGIEGIPARILLEYQKPKG